MKSNKADFALRLEAIIDTAIDGILTIDQMGTVETMNQAAAELFQYDATDVIGHNIKILMPEPYHSEHDGYLKRYNETKIPHIIGIGREVKGRKKDGEAFPFRLAVSEVILNDRIIFTGIVHDLSEIKASQEKFKRLNAELEEKVVVRTQELEDAVNTLLSTNRNLESEIFRRKEVENKLKENETELTKALETEKELNILKSRFVSMASHEFRTPLASILSSAALIQRYEQEDQQSNRVRHISKIKSAVANLTGILNDFLSLSKLEEGKITINYSKVNLNTLCKDIIEDVDALLKGQKIIHEFHGSDPHIHSDERILKNILFNIISNAIKYSEKDIFCDVYLKEDNFEIKIKDQGIGIPESEQKHLFSRFFRANNVSNIQGTGLGLNIVKRYVELLKGNIKFESVENEGTTFTIRIPNHNQ